MITLDKFTTHLKTQLMGGNISHAYLVFGEFNEETLVEIFKVTQPDIFKLSENPIKIGHIRELISWLYLKPHSSEKKLAILYGVENMTIEAANSLLKALEEPPSFVVIVLQALKKERILPTILSRCEIVREKEDNDKIIPENYLNILKISKMSVKERFDYTVKIMDDENLKNIINLWEEETRLELLEGGDKRELLNQISKARSLLSTNTSVKLLLENLLLNF